MLAEKAKVALQRHSSSKLSIANFAPQGQEIEFFIDRVQPGAWEKFLATILT
jgi:hypothetical protein